MSLPRIYSQPQIEISGASIDIKDKKYNFVRSNDTDQTEEISDINYSNWDPSIHYQLQEMPNLTISRISFSK